MTADHAAGARTPRLDSLTSLRWWAALAVFFFHVRNIVPLPDPVAEVARYGYLGVTFFFVLSGFVLTWSWRPSVGIGTFYWRRFARIWPLHVVALLIAIPVFYSFSPDPDQAWVKPYSVIVLILSLLLLQGWSRDPVVLFGGNPAAWTLTAEMFFYALHPFITKALRLLSGRAALWAAITILALSVLARVAILADPTGWLAMLPWPVLRLNEFVIGMCLAWSFRQGWRPRLPIWLPVVLMAAYLSSVSLLESRPEYAVVYGVLVGHVSEIMTALFALLICACAVSDLEGRTRIGRSRVLVALGEWSYAFYLVHATLIYALREQIGLQYGKTGAVWILVLLCSSIALAWLLHVTVERPLERRLRAWQNGLVQRRENRRKTQRDDTTSEDLRIESGGS
ncbi:acyltransferase [Microbacterium sp. NPDC077486]|uniref:acyltransferase family protein n=1 Tax=Microbacterium sp. NPDC077486 TaxID=3154766 RepID=UPI00343EA24D